MNLYTFRIEEQDGEHEHNDDCYVLAKNALDASNQARAYAKSYYDGAELIDKEDGIYSAWGSSWRITRWPTLVILAEIMTISGEMVQLLPLMKPSRDIPDHKAGIELRAFRKAGEKKGHVFGHIRKYGDLRPVYMHRCLECGRSVYLDMSTGATWGDAIEFCNQGGHNATSNTSLQA